MERGEAGTPEPRPDRRRYRHPRSSGGGGMEEQIAQAERDLRSIQMEEDRAVRLFVSGKITEAQLDLQRKFITERLESARAKLDDYRAREASGTEKRRLMEEVLAWAREFGQGLDELTPEERHDYLQMIVEQVIIDRDNNVDITLAIPIDDDSSDPDSPDPESPQPECVSIGSQEPSPCDSSWACCPSLILVGHGHKDGIVLSDRPSPAARRVPRRVRRGPPARHGFRRH